MTREEALQWLTNEKWKNANNKYKKEWNEAFDMAIEALSAEEAVWKEYEAEFTDLPDIPRYYYEKVVGNMAHEINVLRGQLESAEPVQGEWVDVESEPYCECSVCGSYIDNLDDDYAFCPRCGARMEANE